MYRWYRRRGGGECIVGTGGEEVNVSLVQVGRKVMFSVMNVKRQVK